MTTDQLTHPHRGPTRTASAFALTVAGVLLWGTLGISGAEVVAATGMSGVTISLLRFVVAGTVLTLGLAVTGRLRHVPRTRPVATRVGLTALGSAAFATLYLEAVPRAGVATATVVALGVGPVVVVLATAVRRRTMPATKTVLGVGAALVGLLLVCSAPTESGSAELGGGAVVGVLLATLSGVAFAAVTLLNRRPVPGLGAAPLLGLSLLAGAVIVAAVVPFTENNEVKLNLAGAGWLLFMALVPTVLGYLLFYGGLNRGLPATTASVVALLEVLSASVLAVVFLGERLEVPGLLGLALVLASAHAVRPARQRVSRATPSS